MPTVSVSWRKNDRRTIAMKMASKRNPTWNREELILCLDLYRREGLNASVEKREELASLLNSLRFDASGKELPTRTKKSVESKLGNFEFLNPQGGKGLSNHSVGDLRVWTDFWGTPDRLSMTAGSIRANVAEVKKALLEGAGYEIAEAPEGRVLTRTHQIRERSPKLIEAKKSKIFDETGRLECEACRFDFDVSYGERGRGFIECHHTLPVSQLNPDHKTKLEELALVCANCHRMIHRKAPWLSMNQLKELVTKFRR